MIKIKHCQLNLKFFASLFCITGLLLCGQNSLLYAATDANPSINSEQNITIKGIVTNSEDGMAIPGVNIVVKGTTKGSTTDFDGHYSLSVSSQDAILIFSYLGYLTKEVTVGGNSNINVILEPDPETLDEVVVVGFGTATKETLSGSIEQVTSDVFEDRAVSNVALALQGQSPGLVINRNTPRPGNENINLQIRGATSVNGGSPLIVIDGAPAFDDSEFFQMNPDDIESISILKDGAASIYGSRAANGVILVTTKKGKGKMKVEFNSVFRMNYIGLNPPVPTMQQYGQLWLDAAEQDTVPNYWNWGEDTVRAMAAGESGFQQTTPDGWGVNGLVYLAPANRYDELYGSSTGHQESLSLSGSSDQARYRLSFGLSESEGALKLAYDGIKQYSIRLNTDFDITEKLNLAANIALQKNITSSPSSGFGQNLISQDPPVFPSKNPQGQWYGNFGVGGTNSIAAISEGGRDTMEENLAKFTLNLSYDIGYGFSVNANATYNHVNSRQDITLLNVPTFKWEGAPTGNGVNNTSSITAEHITKEYQTYGGFLNYDKTLNNHNFGVMAGMTAEKNDFKALWGQRFNVPTGGALNLLVADPSIQNNGGSNEPGTTNNNRGQDQEGLYSYLTRINYDYDEKYLLELVGRRDGSSRFAPGFKFNNYGSASLGWNLHRESFLENLDVLSNLKVRASIGSSGNQVGIGPYDYLSTISIGQELFGEGGLLSSTASVNGLTTTTRTWEDVVIKNIGIDFALFNNKLSGSFDTYERKNNGMLVGITYPQVLGLTAPETNSGDLETTGWEVALNWRDKKGDFSYNIGVNMSDSNNTLVNLEGGNSIQAGLRRTVEGFPLNSYFIYETDGLFQTQTEVDAYNAQYDLGGSDVPTGSSALRIGDTRIVDLDGNGLINDQNSENDKGQGDVKFAGDSQAHYIFGINLGAKYKGFDFTAFLQGALEQTVIRNGVNNFPFNNPWPNQTIAYNGQTWTPENTGATYPRLTAQRSLARWNWSNTDVFTQDGKYMRLKSLVIGYSFPPSVIDKLNLDKLRIYFSGNDLWETTSIVDSFDPESANTAANNDGNSVNRSIYPFQRTIAVGLNIAF